MILDIQNLTKLYKNGRGASNISFSLEKGDVFGLLGPNGSGKTTIMKAIAGLVAPQSGQVTICGFSAYKQREKALGNMGCLIEAPALFENMTALDNLKMAARFYPGVKLPRITEILDLCGMLRYKKDRVGSFSLGMRQRVGLALALISNPELLVLDEPANGLDIEGMVYIRDIIKKHAENGNAVLVSSHLAHEIELCANKVGIMHEGELISSASMDEALSASPSLEHYYLSEVARFREERRPAV